jgi:hypothetical protein
MNSFNVKWADVKAFVDTRGVSVQFVEAANEYLVMAIDGAFILNCRIQKTGSAEQTDFEDNYKPSGNDKLDKKTGLGISKIAVTEEDGSNFLAMVSHDFTDPTTWWGESVRVTGEALSGSGVGPYTSANTNWIDLENGKVPREDTFSSSYIPVIYDNGVPVTSGITIDYAAGTVTFDSAPTGPVTADYSYENGSAWIVKPDPGKVLKIRHAEIDFTTDIGFQPTEFQLWAYNPLDLPNKVMVDLTTYKNMKDIFKIANTVEEIRALGEITNPTVRVVFEYSRAIPLLDSAGMELRICMLGDTPMTGEFGSATIYTVSEDE